MVKIVKNSGKVVEFDRNKLRNSLCASGAKTLLVEEVIQKIEKEVFEGVSTKQIYKMAFGLLKKISNSHAARYNLRTGIQMLGPEGFTFEKYIARILEADGYETVLNLKLNGHCVSHEVDVLARKGEKLMMVECKFHSGIEATSDVKVPMYILSRFNDLKKNLHPIFGKKDAITDCMIVTNNRFTADAITFATCSGMYLMDWNYPEKSSLKARSDDNLLYPITCLTTLSIAEKQKLLAMNIIIANEIKQSPEVLEKIELSPNRQDIVLKEVTNLCKSF